MNSAADFGGMFIIPDVNVRVSVQIINMGDKGPWETTGYQSLEFRTEEGDHPAWFNAPL